MRTPFRSSATVLLFLLAAGVSGGPEPVDWAMVARIRAEGLQRSQVMNYESYMTDVLGARLTLSSDMQRAQQWAQAELKSIGLVNVVAEPFMEFGVTWDNEYVSLHMLAPDYQPMVGYPLAHTRGTDGQVVADAVIVDLRVQGDLDTYRGTLRGKAVLSTPPAAIDLAPLTNGVPRRTPEELQALQQTVVAPARPMAPRTPANPDLLTAEEKSAFFAAEGVAAVLQSESGWLGAVRGFSRPGARNDRWSRAGMLAGPVIVAITPEHYNRMYRVVQRGIPVTVELEVRNRLGTVVEQAVNITADIPGSDLKDQVVMIGAHFDTWHASPNASDNTSGVAVVLEAARILKAVGAKPRRTIRVALWSGEEQGLWGSRAYVRRHFGHPDSAGGVTPDYDRLQAYFNQDYGPGQYLGIYLQGNEQARGMLAAWMEPFRDFGMTVVSNQGVGSTDHVAFDEVGLPGFQFLQDRVPGTGGHTNLDFYDTIQAEDLMKNAVVLASYAWHAAMTPNRIPRKPRP
ncbi:MAG TPA: M20/M25/M40 family metallo-hydrolase [Gemmatimonadales bacterium]|nr:M20/M25/M40 family metallo-hydrolase [Gemmatimonadales bacterium]